MALNVSALSTSAAAPNGRVELSVSRRGTCDRGIWTKPLAFPADAGEAYGICFGVSKFVRVQDGWMGRVSKRDWSLWGKWSAIGGRFLVRVEGRSGWGATIRDTTTPASQLFPSYRKNLCPDRRRVRRALSPVARQARARANPAVSSSSVPSEKAGSGHHAAASAAPAASCKSRLHSLITLVDSGG